jgi:DNA-directed RNA polymerase subunit alpha
VGKLEMELTSSAGRGYVSAQAQLAGVEIGRIPVDSIYSPVLKVTYKVEATRVEQRTDFDKPGRGRRDQAVHACRATRRRPARPSWSCSGSPASSTSRPKAWTSARRPRTSMAEQLSMPIEALNLSVRSYNCLKREGVAHRG